MGKILMAEASPLQTAWLRYASAWLACLVLGLYTMIRKREAPQNLLRVFYPKHFYWIMLMGLLTFFWSCYAQYSGLARSTSTANSLLVAMEPLIAVFLARIFLKEHLRPYQILAFHFAIFGFCLLSNLHPAHIRESLNLFNYGNVLLLLALPAEAMYSIISRKLIHSLPATAIFSYALTFGLLCFTIFIFYILKEPYPNLMKLSRKSYMAILWMGPLGTTITYIYWAHAFKKAPVAIVSLTLFLQPIQGAIIGISLLGERFSSWQILGGALILLALVIQSVPQFRKEALP